MGGNSNKMKKQRKSIGCFSSIFNAFKPRDHGAAAGRMRNMRSRSCDNYDHIHMEDNARVWPSDEDKGRHWVAEPGIDRKAKAYIDRIHQIRFSETESQTHMI